MPGQIEARMPSSWKSRFGEILTIVLGILIAFALDSGWDTLQERRQEARLLRALAEEVGQSIDLVDAGIRDHTRLEQNTRLLLDRMAAARLGDTIEVPDSLLYSLMSGKSVNFSRIELDGAASSGRIDLIGNAEIRAQVAALSGLFDDLAEDETSSGVLILEVLLPGLAGKMELSPTYSVTLDWSQPFLATPRWVHVTEATRTLVASKASLEYWIVYEARALRATLRKLAESIEREIG